ncbi:MAG: MATE family efflux transporter [Clostridia bacterium]|nr:MATE family efflux transporter [Clostridia bacterium]
MSEGAIIKKDKKRNFILTGNLYKVIISLSMPIMLSNLIQTFYNLADSYFVSRMGEYQLNAVGVVWPIVFTIIGLGTGLSLGAVAVISNDIGAGKPESARLASAQIITFLLALGIAMGTIGYLASPLILRLMQVSGVTYEYAMEYLNIIFIGTPFMYLFFAFQSIQQSQGNMALPMIFSGVSVVMNIVLDPVFIFVLDMGVKGAALATIISRIALGVFSIAYYFLSKKTKYKPNFAQLKPDWNVIGQISRTGIPASLGQTTTSIGFMVINGLVLSYGDNVLTAFIIGNRIVSLITMPSMGIGNALSAIVGQNSGAELMHRTKEALSKAFQVSMAFVVFGIALLLIFGMDFIVLFTDDINVITYAQEYALIITLALPLMGIFSIWTGLFIGLGKGIYSMIVMMSRLWIYRIPSILVLKYIFDVNQFAVWYPVIISNALSCLTGLYLYRRLNLLSVKPKKNKNEGKKEIVNETCDCQ